MLGQLFGSKDRDYEWDNLSTIYVNSSGGDHPPQPLFSAGIIFNSEYDGNAFNSDDEKESDNADKEGGGQPLQLDNGQQQEIISNLVPRASYLHIGRAVQEAMETRLYY